MKKYINMIFLSLFFFFMMPLCTFALSYESGIYAKNEAVKDFEMGNIIVKNIAVTNYYSYASTNSRAFHFSGKLLNNYGRDAEFEVIIKTFDSSKNLLNELKNIYTVTAGGQYVLDIPIIAKEIDYDFNLISYYSIRINVLTDVERENKVVNDQYYFTEYSVDVDISKDNVYLISENINASYRNFIIPIEKKIPVRNRYHSNYKYHNKRAIISDIRSDGYYTLDFNEGYRIVSLGKENRDEKLANYKVSYKYNVGKDTLEDNDEIVYFFNNTYDAKIDKLKYNIYLPKEVDDIKVTFVDNEGHVLEDYNYTVNGTLISGEIDQVIEPDQIIGIRVVLPDYYFENATSNISSISILSIIVPILLTVISVIIWFVFGNHKTDKNTVLYPYKALNSLEIGYLYNGKVLENDIATLVFYLANKGYIEVVKENNKYKLVKVKDYKSNNEVEKVFMEYLFKDRVEVTSKELTKSLYRITKMVRDIQDNDKNKKTLFVNSIFNYKIVFWLMIGVIFVMVTINLINEYTPKHLMINLIVSGLGYGLLLFSLLGNNKKIEKMIMGSIAIIMVIAPLALTVLGAFKVDILITMSYIIGVVCMFSIGYIAKAMPCRTIFGFKVLKSINGYKNTLLNCGIDYIAKEVKSNHNYFYDVLPYSFVLGISDKWFKRCASLKISKPDWYDCEKDSLDEFYSTMKEIYSDIYFALKNTNNKK